MSDLTRWEPNFSFSLNVDSQKIVDTTKAKVLSCSEENGELAVTMAEAKMLRQASDSQQMYDVSFLNLDNY